jgi:hypothetical protein
MKAPAGRNRRAGLEDRLRQSRLAPKESALAQDARGNNNTSDTRAASCCRQPK